MITVKKTIAITFDGEHIETLRDTCELARIYMQDHQDEKWAGGGMSPDDRSRIRRFLDDVFAYTG